MSRARILFAGLRRRFILGHEDRAARFKGSLPRDPISPSRHPSHEHWVDSTGHADMGDTYLMGYRTEKGVFAVIAEIKL